MMILSGAVFALAPTRHADVRTSGSLSHTNGKEDSAILTATLMKPGDITQGTVTITNDGDLPGTFSLTTSNLVDAPGPNGGKLSDVLQLEIIDRTMSTIIYRGRVASVGTVFAGACAAGASHTYGFTVTFPDGGVPEGATTGDNAYLRSALSIQFDWIQVQ